MTEVANRKPSKEVAGRKSSKENAEQPVAQETGGRKSSKENAEQPVVKEAGGRKSSKENAEQPVAQEGAGRKSSKENAEQPVVKEVAGRKSSKENAEQQAVQEVAGRRKSSKEMPSQDTPGATEKELLGDGATTEGEGRRASKGSKESVNRRASKDTVGFASDVGDNDDLQGESERQARRERSSDRKASKESKQSATDIGRQKSRDSGGLSHRSIMSQRSMRSSMSQRSLPETYVPAHKVIHRDPKAERDFVRQRRGDIGRGRNLYDMLDDEFDKGFRNTTDCSGWLEHCCSAIDTHQAEQVVVSEKTGEGIDRKFGFPDWESCGYCLTPPEEMEWPDQIVPKRLGLQMATHRKTSIERLCHQQKKSAVPITASNEHIHLVIRNLRKSDHANVLRCIDVYEDEHNLYLLYEYIHCVTLMSVLEQQSWTQEQIVNLVRECCAAVAYCCGNGLNHLGWTLCDVLLPSNCLQDGPKFAKIYGFGLLGTLHGASTDFFCWAPEAVEAFQKVGDAFTTRLENAQKYGCDMWSLGTIIYSIISRRLPILGSQEEVQARILKKEWTFSVAFDEFDGEAKQLVEGLMHSKCKERLRADVALQNPWIRRRWKPSPNADEIFVKLEKFCNCSLAKRLFGRFLVRFLDDGHMTQVARAFYCLDSRGQGTIDARDLRNACSAAGSSHTAVKDVTDWFFADGINSMSLCRFAESMAEEVIDGRALRHSFESLDDDGSGCISAEELFDELKEFSNELTMEDIKAHIQTAEVGGDDTQTAGDHKLDYAEYMQLFPGRIRQVKVLEDRFASAREQGEKLSVDFNGVKDKVREWLKELDHEANALTKLSASVDQHSGVVVKDIQKRLKRVGQLLSNPPGPYDFKEEMNNFATECKRHKRKGSKDKADHVATGTYGYESFVQDHAIHSFWPQLIQGEIRMVKHAVHMEHGQTEPVVDVYKATDSVNIAVKKVDEVVDWTKAQLLEYESFVDVLGSTESAIHTLVYSSRGIQKHECEETSGDAS